MILREWGRRRRRRLVCVSGLDVIFCWGGMEEDLGGPMPFCGEGKGGLRGVLLEEELLVGINNRVSG